MSVLVQLPGAPLTENTAENRRIHVQDVVLGEAQFTLSQIARTIETDTNVQRIAGLVFDLIELYNYRRRK